MAKLLRLEGSGGAKIYSGEYFTEESAREDYVNQTGYEPTREDALGFDSCDWVELRNFARLGNE